MPSNSRESIARKQRTTLRNGEKLIDAFRSGPRTSFTSNSAHARRPFLSTPQKWRDAFLIGQYNDKNKPIIGQLFQKMFHDKLDIPDDEKWQPVKPLGNGSYGAAALFKHENEQGQVDDYVVAKYTEYREQDMIKTCDCDISLEAAIMMQLNELDNDGILFLREFRYFADTQRHLYLTEYCPNFDCDVLRMTHKAMRRHIPEAFIWYLFYAIAKGLVAMEQGPFGNYAEPHEHIEGTFLVHRDIKPPNTFLGYTPAPLQPLDESDPGYLGSHFNYPHAKIADFGLSQITTLGDEDNMANNHKAGSYYWFPPEVRLNEFDPHSSWYPFRATCFDLSGNPLPSSEELYDKGGHSYTAAGNIFVAGFMVYQFITLDEPETMSAYLDRCMCGQEVPVPQNVLNPGDIDQRYAILQYLDEALTSGQGLTDTHTRLRERLYSIRAMLLRWQNADYSPVLKDLVEQCMAFQPEHRISAADLLAQLEALLPYYWQTLKQMRNLDQRAYDEATRAFTTEADLPHMDPGTADVESDARFWRRLVRGCKWLDISAGNIRPVMDPDDNDIPEEARAMFGRGRKEETTRLTERRGQSDNDARIHLAEYTRFRPAAAQLDEDPDEHTQLLARASDGLFFGEGQAAPQLS